MTWRNYFRLLAEDHPYVNRSAWFWKPILKITSLFYLMGLNIHKLLYSAGIFRTQSFSVPVISVGNITWGGTGKTPIVEYVARFFLNRRRVPLVLTRGYGADESKLLAKQLPDAKFGIGKDRFQTAQNILKNQQIDVIILDDGMQHWKIKKNLEIVAINVLNPFGNGSLIPRGILREPMEALKRASLIVLTDVNLTPRKELETLKSKIRSIVSNVEFIEAHREPLYFYRPETRERISVDRLQGQRITTFSGIGTPRSFQMLLNQIGLKNVRNFEFSDHHPYSESELMEIVKMKESSESQEIVTTEKDFYRCERTMRTIVKPLILKVRLRLANGESILHQNLSKFAGSDVSRFDSVEHKAHNGKPEMNKEIKEPKNLEPDNQNA